jgi:hypothetical protein
MIVGATEEDPATGRAADAGGYQGQKVGVYLTCNLVKAAWTAAEAAMRYLKVGEKNYSVTDIVDKVTTIWDCKPVESECQLTLLYTLRD